MVAIKAINPSRLAMKNWGARSVSLDKVIDTMSGTVVRCFPSTRKPHREDWR